MSEAQLRITAFLDDRASEGLRRLEQNIQRVGKSSVRLTDVTNSLSSAMRNITFSTMGMYFGFLFSTIGAQRVRNAQQRYNEAIERYGALSEEAKEALYDLQAAQQAQMITQARLIVDTIDFASNIPRIIEGFANFARTLRAFATASKVASAAESAFTATAVQGSIARTAAIAAETQAIQRQSIALAIRNALAGPVGWALLAGGVAAAAGLYYVMQQGQQRIPALQTLPGEFKEVKRTGLAIVHEGERIGRPISSTISVNFNAPIYMKPQGDSVDEIARDLAERVRMRLRVVR